MACALARTALQILVEEKLIGRSAELGDYFLAKLKAIRSSVVREIRGRGLWIGIELTTDARPYSEALKEEGILSKETHGRIIRIAPPLVIEREQVDWACARLAKVLG